MDFGKRNQRHEGETETKVGKVTNMKPSPTDRGKMRLNMVSKTGSRQAYALEVDAKHAKGIERKKLYEAEVYEKEDMSGARGGMQKRSTSLGQRTYMCDDAPTEYTGKHKPQFKNFGSGDRNESSSRLKF